MVARRADAFVPSAHPSPSLAPWPGEFEDAFWKALAIECAEDRDRQRLELPPLHDRRPNPEAAAIIGGDPQVVARFLGIGNAPRPAPTNKVQLEDKLREVEPRVYVELLAGIEVPRSGMIRCPLPDHEDRWPSFKVYESPERGVWCHGCQRGGSIYDFAAGLWGIGTRGEDFKALRRRLADELLGRAAA